MIDYPVEILGEPSKDSYPKIYSGLDKFISTITGMLVGAIIGLSISVIVSPEHDWDISEAWAFAMIVIIAAGLMLGGCYFNKNRFALKENC